MMRSVWVILRDLDGAPEVDVFDTQEAADEHLRRLGGPGDTRLDVREEIVYTESFAEEDDRAELDRLVAEFDAAGGRGVELAERIDALRAKLEEETS